MDWHYEAIDVAPGQLNAFVEGCLADESWAGLSVTAPHKDAIVQFGEPDEPTRILGCANTLVLSEEPRVHNTDVAGFGVALRAATVQAPRRVAIVGNGATARSILLAVVQLGARECVVLARNPQRAVDLQLLADSLGIDAQVQALDAPLERIDLLASTIPAAATAPHAERWAQAATTFFDVVYDPWPTPLGVAAERLHRRALSGLDLLAGQAVDQFALLTGRTVSFEACLSAAKQELRRRATL